MNEQWPWLDYEGRNFLSNDRLSRVRVTIDGDWIDE
jgi:hypothetical protein